MPTTTTADRPATKLAWPSTELLRQLTSLMDGVDSVLDEATTPIRPMIRAFDDDESGVEPPTLEQVAELYRFVATARRQLKYAADNVDKFAQLLERAAIETTWPGDDAR